MVNNIEQHNFWENIKDYNSEIDSVLDNKNELTNTIKKINIKNKIVTDIGCGSGNLFKYIKDSKKIIAVDFSKNMLNFAKQKAKKLEINNIEFLNINTITNPIPIKADILFSINAFFPENYEQIQKFKINIKNSIKKMEKYTSYYLLFESFIRDIQVYTKFCFQKFQNNQTEENYNLLQAYLNLKLNPNGYHHCGKRIRKYWLKEEIIDEFSNDFIIYDIQELKFPRKDYDFIFKRYFIKLKIKN